MDQFIRLSRRHNFITKLSAAFFYAVAMAVALNFFWEPGHIYASGVTGFAQIIQNFSQHFLPFTLTTSVMYFALNVPLFIIAWFKIGHRFTYFSVVAVVLGSLMINVIPPIKITFDPIICALFGGLINGAGTGFALRNGISTGGLDIVGIMVHKKTGRSVGTINILVNVIIMIFAGLSFGWIHALYTAISIFVNGRVIDLIFTQHQRMQVMIVTQHPKEIIAGIQAKMRRGITVIHDVEGAYGHAEKTILFSIIARYEMYDFEQIIKENDPTAFASITEVVKTIGRFKEVEVE